MTICDAGSREPLERHRSISDLNWGCRGFGMDDRHLHAEAEDVSGPNNAM